MPTGYIVCRISTTDVILWPHLPAPALNRADVGSLVIRAGRQGSTPARSETTRP